MTDQIIDEAALAELRSIMGDDFQLLIDTFINDSEQRIVALQEAVDNRDAELLRTSAHSFKGSSLNISAGRLTKICQDLEDRGRELRLEGVDIALEDLKIAYDDVKAYFSV